jgi:hypothetical protein
MIGLFQKNMRNAKPRRMRSGTQTARAGSYYGDAETRSHFSSPMSLSAIVTRYLLNGKYVAV